MIRQKPGPYLFYLFFLTFSVSSQVSIDESFLDLKKESWNIGINRFTNMNLQKQHEYLLTALPLLLLDEISDIRSHQFSEEEKQYYRNRHLEQQIKRVEKDKSEIHKQRDRLLFSGEEEKEREIKYRDFSEQIDEKNELISLWKNLNPEDLLMNKELPVDIKAYTGERTQLLEPRSQTGIFMKSENLDLLLSGSIENLDEMFFLTFNCFSITGETPLFELSRLVSEDELNSVILEAADELRSIILGRKWSELSVSVSPEDALIEVDGITMGVGTLHSKVLNPGFASLTVNSSGYQSQSRQIYLPPEGKQKLEFDLIQGVSESLFIFSDPPGADVYLGALWLGQTPIFTEKPSEQELFKVSKDNYMPFYLSSDKMEGESITVRLGTSMYDKEQKLKQTKSAFYKSLGWFSLSVGIPLILNGIYQNQYNRYYNYAVDYNTTGNPDSYDNALTYLNYANIAYYGFWGGVAISGSLFVNSMFKLRDYIKAAEESTEE